ncbi:NAD(P)H-dependent glycerol-3-phosphate dehydrogenase [Petrotoga olearia]|uniref:Glycerol-3-phosphate dehydrogenase [NAD(P)+] n=2 Tax=Petrotoga olearia TaxID=156203 RepID=A0A2K1P2C9_9BACT|nr:NAD(P)H-dependent glycerol-3-phosphate dehydrogenase [Petrotoga olearia]PNR96941.1 glycerol-3-phosphate dehydrogenase [Petrotoga olearia DSM 13574]RMA70551.1 glycerol 3-phosphate dehydrogenase (NAD(P)+) [Petrotoga olearia]
MSHITVLGAGSWGTAIAKHLVSNHQKVTIWDRDKKLLQEIKKGINPRYLSNVKLPTKEIKVEGSINESLENAQIVIIAIPVQHISEVLSKIHKDSLKNKDVIFVNLSKGMEITSQKIPSKIFEEYLPGFNYCTLSGPSHAEEVAEMVPTSVVAAGRDSKVNKYIQEIFSNETFRVYTNNDLIGVEISGAIKNIYAIGAGIIDGFGKWDNTKAALITRSLVEIIRYGTYYGGNKETFMGLAGIGDLVVTCTSSHSRNRYVGEMLSKGMSLKTILEQMAMVAEGVYTAKAVYNDAKEKEIEMPIANKIYQVLYEGVDPKTAIYKLMTRDLKSEFFN